MFNIFNTIIQLVVLNIFNQQIRSNAMLSVNPEIEYTDAPYSLIPLSFEENDINMEDTHHFNFLEDLSSNELGIGECFDMDGFRYYM